MARQSGPGVEMMGKSVGESIFRGRLPLVVQRDRYGSLGRDRALPLRAAPDARRRTMPGSSTRSGGRPLRVRSVELLCESGVQDIA